MIVETIFSTLNPDGLPNFAPMGVEWGEDELIVRPFRNTHTCANLLATGCGVASVTDDVMAFVEGAFGDPALPHFPAQAVSGVVFAGACSWRELAVVARGGTSVRAEVRCRVAGRGQRREFVGFNRARSAVIEAAILATRLHLLDPAAVRASLDQYETLVIKTGDAAERAALERVRQYVRAVWHETAP